ncbi:MAG: hypothetical protein ACREN2_08845 [Candidatus Dormibacteria bacterium]
MKSIADYGPATSTSTEGVMVALIFLGASLITGGLAYADGVLQPLLVIVGIVAFVSAIYLGMSIKPKKAAK